MSLLSSPLESLRKKIVIALYHSLIWSANLLICDPKCVCVLALYWISKIQFLLSKKNWQCMICTIQALFCFQYKYWSLFHFHHSKFCLQHKTICYFQLTLNFVNPQSTTMSKLVSLSYSVNFLLLHINLSDFCIFTEVFLPPFV